MRPSRTALVVDALFGAFASVAFLQVCVWVGGVWWGVMWVWVWVWVYVCVRVCVWVWM